MVGGLVFIAGGVYFYLKVHERASSTEAGRAYWAGIRERQPTFAKFVPPALVILGIFRPTTALLS